MVSITRWVRSLVGGVEVVVVMVVVFGFGDVLIDLFFFFWDRRKKMEVGCKLICDVISGGGGV